MKILYSKPLYGMAGASIILVLLGAGIARAQTTSVTATKDTSATMVTEGPFSMVQGQTVYWTATYTGTPTQGHRFYVSTVSSSLADIQLTASASQASGSKFLAAGNYHISIKTALMGPGIYTIKYDPTGNGANNGEPHITTVDGVHYDFQSAGEFVALRDGSGMEIQTRQTPLATAYTIANAYNGLTTGVSYNTAVAARVGGHRVTYQINAGANPDTRGLQLRVDGVPTNLPSGGMSLGSGGRVMPSGTGIRIDFPNGTVLVVTPQYWAAQNMRYLDLDVFRTPAREGIMGMMAPGSWLPALPDGTALGPRPAQKHQRYVQLYDKFASAWRVTDRTSLFDYEPGTSTATFTLAGWPPEQPPFAIPGQVLIQPATMGVARRACRAIVARTLKEDCIFDVRVTGDAGLAKNYRLLEQIRRGTTSTMVSREGDAPGAYTAIVTRLSRTGKGAPTGTVQFTLDGRDMGAPVSLDATGKAIWKASRETGGEHRIAAKYIPAKGSPYLLSQSLDEPYR